MTVLHVITSLRSGGAEKLLTELLPRLQGYGIEPEVLVLDGTETPFMQQLRAAGIPVHALAQGYAQMRNPLLLFKLRRAIKPYPIVHAHNTSCQYLTALAAHKGQTLYTTEHNTNNRRRGWPLMRCLDRWMYRRYKTVVCVSAATERALRAWTGISHTTLIPNGL